jgi:hypothetical protein
MNNDETWLGQWQVTGETRLCFVYKNMSQVANRETRFNDDKHSSKGFVTK